MKTDECMALVIQGGHQIHRVILVPATLFQYPNQNNYRLLGQLVGHYDQEYATPEIVQCETIEEVLSAIREMNCDEAGEDLPLAEEDEDGSEGS